MLIIQISLGIVLGFILLGLIQQDWFWAFLGRVVKWGFLASILILAAILNSRPTEKSTTPLKTSIPKSDIPWYEDYSYDFSKLNCPAGYSPTGYSIDGGFPNTDPTSKAVFGCALNSDPNNPYKTIPADKLFIPMDPVQSALSVTPLYNQGTIIAPK